MLFRSQVCKSKGFKSNHYKFKLIGALAGVLCSLSAVGSDTWLQYAGPLLNRPGSPPKVLEADTRAEATTVSDVDGLGLRCTFEMVGVRAVKPYWGFRTCTLTDGARSLTMMVRGSVPGLPTDPNRPTHVGQAGDSTVNTFTRQRYKYTFTYKWLLVEGHWGWVLTDVVVTWLGEVPPPVQQ